MHFGSGLSHLWKAFAPASGTGHGFSRADSWE